MDERALRRMVREIAERVLAEESARARPADPGPAAPAPDDAFAARVARWTGRALAAAPSAAGFRPEGDRSFYRNATPARIDVGRAGVRYRTATLLAFQEAHAAARDAVRAAVSPAFLERLGLVPLRSTARDRTEFLLRPDLGRKLAAESLETARRSGARAPKVQIVVADGLSSAAIEAQLPLLLPALVADLERGGAPPGPVFFVADGRMAVGDEVGRAVGAEVLCTIVGERPGLATAESLGAYVTYLKAREVNEAMRSMISNIHAGGLPPEEGARQLAALCLRALRDRRTGVEPAP
jgi:ethanolamine ammonia-lyase small subunit